MNPAASTSRLIEPPNMRVQRILAARFARGGSPLTRGPLGGPADGVCASTSGNAAASGGGMLRRRRIR